MKRLALFTVSFLFSQNAHGTQNNLLQDLPGELLVHMTSFLSPEDALSVAKVSKRTHALKPLIKLQQMPALYAKEKLDYSRSLFPFMGGQRHFNKTAPEGMGLIIHEWYLEGRKSPNYGRRFLHLFAAARAGHRLAAQEVSEMLLTKRALEVPLKTTMEALVGSVKEFSSREDIRNWDLSQMQRPMVLNPELLALYMDNKGVEKSALLGFEAAAKDLNRVLWGARTPATSGSKDSSVGNDDSLDRAQMIVDNMIANYQLHLNNYLERLDAFIASPRIPTAGKKEAHLLRQEALMEYKSGEKMFLGLLIEGIQKEDQQRSRSGNNKNVQTVLEFLRKRHDAVMPHPLDMNEFSEIEYGRFPVYWQTMATCHLLRGEKAQEIQAQMRLCNMINEVDAVEELSTSLLERAKPLKGHNEVAYVDHACHAITILSCASVLGSQPATCDLVSGLNDIQNSLNNGLRQRAFTKESFTNAHRNWYTKSRFAAFALQLSLFRALQTGDRSDLRKIRSSLIRFYTMKKKTIIRDRLTDVELNIDRATAASNWTEGLEKDGTNRKGRLNKVALTLEGLALNN